MEQTSEFISQRINPVVIAKEWVDKHVGSIPGDVFTAAGQQNQYIEGTLPNASGEKTTEKTVYLDFDIDKYLYFDETTKMYISIAPSIVTTKNMIIENNHIHKIINDEDIVYRVETKELALALIAVEEYSHAFYLAQTKPHYLEYIFDSTQYEGQPHEFYALIQQLRFVNNLFTDKDIQSQLGIQDEAKLQITRVGLLNRLKRSLRYLPPDQGFAELVDLLDEQDTLIKTGDYLDMLQNVKTIAKGADKLADDEISNHLRELFQGLHPLLSISQFRDQVEIDFADPRYIQSEYHQTPVSFYPDSIRMLHGFQEITVRSRNALGTSLNVDDNNKDNQEYEIEIKHDPMKSTNENDLTQEDIQALGIIITITEAAKALSDFIKTTGSNVYINGKVLDFALLQDLPDDPKIHFLKGVYQRGLARLQHYATEPSNYDDITADVRVFDSNLQLTHRVYTILPKCA